jgi:hypothetical protein
MKDVVHVRIFVKNYKIMKTTNKNSRHQKPDLLFRVLFSSEQVDISNDS